MFLALCIPTSQRQPPRLHRTSLTESGIKHVERHLVTFLRARDGNQPLVAVVLWLIDLDYTAAKLAYLIDLGATLADDRTDHVVRNEDLLCAPGVGGAQLQSKQAAAGRGRRSALGPEAAAAEVVHEDTEHHTGLRACVVAGSCVVGSFRDARTGRQPVAERMEQLASHPARHQRGRHSASHKRTMRVHQNDP